MSVIFIIFLIMFYLKEKYDVLLMLFGVISFIIL